MLHHIMYAVFLQFDLLFEACHYMVVFCVYSMNWGKFFVRILISDFWWDVSNCWVNR